jgi:capsular exopolysaccharide synthesis family protein
VSKFFKALEKVEPEHDVTAEPVAAPVTPSPSAPAATVITEPLPRPVSAPPIEAPAAPVPESSRPEPAPPAAPSTKPAPRPMVYGAPVAREAASRHGFAWQMEPAADSETGHIDDHLVSLLEPTSFAAEQYRAVRLALETLHHERGTGVVAVASPGRGEGRTMTTLNLAGALAQASDARVALVEADLRHPAVAGYLGLPVGRGLSSYLVDAIMTVDDVVQRPASIAFSVLPAGTASSMPYELLKSPRLAALIAELRRRYDYVLVDTPSALPFPDVGILRDLVDGFIVVVRASRTPREQLQDTMTVLGRQRTLGLVFNDDERTGVPAFKDQGEGAWRRLVPRPLGVARG